VEPESALVWTEGRVELDPKTLVDLDFAAIVDPRHSEQNDSLGFDDPFEDSVVEVLRVPFEDRNKGFHNLLNRLVKLGLPGVASDEIAHELLGEQFLDRAHGHFLLFPLSVTKRPGPGSR
jgi:hypothetical protein